MRPPSAREAEGYDIVVWIDHQGDIVCKAFTRQGHRTLRKFVNEYRKGDIVQIYCSPADFVVEVPSHVIVGLLTGDPAKVRPMVNSTLQ